MSFFRDLRLAVRSLRRAPLFVAAAVLTLALGIGANTAAFGVVRALLLEPLPYESPDELVVVWGDHVEIGHETASLPDFLDWREQASSFSELAAIGNSVALLTGDGDAERVDAAIVSGNLFSTLGMRPILGRTFSTDEELSNGPPVAIIGERLWRGRFAADPTIVGRDVLISGRARTVVGVMPDELPVAGRRDVFMPLKTDTTMGRRADWLGVIGRLAPGVTVEEAGSEMRTIMARLEAEYPQSNAGWSADVVPLHREIVGDVRPALLAFSGAMALVLLIACANVANLFLARSAAREHELGVRVTLGASRGRIVQQLLAESVLLAGAGAVLGVMVANAALGLLGSSPSLQLPRADSIGIDLPVLAFSVSVAAVSALLFGLAPMLRVARGLVRPGLSGSRSVAGGSGVARTRTLLVLGEVALAVILLVGAGLLLRSFDRLQGVPPGFDPGRLLTAQVTLPGEAMMDGDAVFTFWPEVLDRLSASPGVVGAAYVNNPPMGGSGYITFGLEGRPAPTGSEVEDVQPFTVSRDYFRTMGIPLGAGRHFEQADNQTSARVMVVNREFARRFSPDRDVVGRRLTFGDPADTASVWYSIVGVVGNVRQEGLDQPDHPQVYRLVDQVPPRGGFLVLRTASEPMSLAPLVRAAVREAQPNAAVTGLRTMEDRMSETIARPRVSATLLGGFAALALLLAAVGIYGVTSYTTELRMREMGIRMALGSSPSEVQNLIVKQGMTPVFAGLLAGAVGAILAGRVLDRFLFNVGSSDPLTFAFTAALLTAVALAACWVPVRRALRTAPARLLRSE
jgi:putative ABC transport system permease protein